MFDGYLSQDNPPRSGKSTLSFLHEYTNGTSAYGKEEMLAGFNERRDHSNPKYVPTDLSPENPFLDLSQKEYQAFIHYQRAHNIPRRFYASSEIGDCDLLNINTKFHPKFQTTYQDYGMYPGNIHTTAFSYHGLKTKFTKEKTAQGMYKNNSLNL